MRGIAVLVALLPACYGGIDQTNGGTADAGAGAVVADAALPDAHVIDSVDMSMLRAASRVRGFAKINQTTDASSLGTFDIDVYISEDARDYRRIHPETSGSGVTMPVGTVIVRNVLDATGAISKVTLMGKGPAGYDPTIGDWWFGVTDPAGNPLPEDSGTGPQVGRLTECHGCHIPRATDDYLFGVPAADE
jgi:hypothetical protein